MISKIFFYGLVVSAAFQWSNATVLFGRQFKVEKTEKLSIGQSDSPGKVLYLNEQTAVIQEIVNFNLSNLYLTDLSGKKKVKIESVNSSNSRIIAKISFDKKYLSYGYREPQKRKYISKVYHIETGRLITLDSPPTETDNAEVAITSISLAASKILYQVRTEGEVPKTYMADIDGSNPRFIIEGAGGSWSPDGKWFILRPFTEANIPSSEKYRSGKITKEEYDKEIEERKEEMLEDPQDDSAYLADVVCDFHGKPQIKLAGFGNVIGGYQWSPDGTRFTLGSPKGLYIIILNIEDKQILGYKSILVSVTGNSPVWSPNGEYLAYIEHQDDGHNFTKGDIYIVDKKGKNSYNLTPNFQLMACKIIWIPGGILMEECSPNNIFRLTLKTQ